MAVMGDLQLHFGLPPYEERLVAASSIEVANNGYADKVVDTYTMPFTGSLAVTLEVTGYFLNYQNMYFSFPLTTPAPTSVCASTYALSFSATGAACQVVNHVQLWFPNLTSGTVVTIVPRCQVGGGGAPVTFGPFSVNTRAFAT
jgi:hypothetical protein